MDGAAISSLVPNLLDGATDLQFLSLRYNNLIDMPTFGFAASTIITLDLSHNQLLTLNLEAMRDMVHLKFLYVQNFTIINYNL